MAHSVSLREAFDDFLAVKQYQGVSPATMGYVADSPMKMLPKRRTPRTTVDTFTLDEAQAIIKVAKAGRHSRRDVALVTLWSY